MGGGLFRLSVADLSRLAEGFFADGGNLYLAVERNKAGDDFNRRWIFRYQLPGGRQRDMGLGSVDVLGANAPGLSLARELAADARQVLARGLDPIDERKAKLAEKAAALPVPSFAEVTQQYFMAHDVKWTPRVLHQWQMTLRAYCGSINSLRVDLVSTDHVVACLTPIWRTKTQTALRVRNRIERILAFATVKKYRSGDNPAQWANHLDQLLPNPGDFAKRENHAAMPYAQVPAFLAELRARAVTISNLALEFLILNANRTDEVLKAKWSEVDFAARVWTIPAERMKMRKPHDVPLAPRAIEILQAARAVGEKSDYIFAAWGGKQHLSSNAFLALLKKRMNRPDCTTHGFRSSFRDWCGSQTNFPRELAELALAHSVGDATEQAYRRDSQLDKRRKLMEAWANYCCRPPVADGRRVVAFKRLK
jgi:integrase